MDLGDQVAHLDHGEFLLILEGLDGPEGLEALGRRLLDALAAPWATPGPPVSVRLGGVLWDPQDEPSRSALLRRADEALRLFTPGRGSAA